MTQDEETGTILITGAGRRLGRAIALDFGRRSWRVGVHYNASAAEAEEVVAEIERKGGKAAALQADLERLDTLAPLVETCVERLGPPTCLVNNAACFELDTLATLDETSWRLHLDVNLRAPVFLTQAFARALPEGSRGVVINMTDQKVLRPAPDHFSYTIAKSALWTATEMLAQALAPRIRVNAIAPGPVLPSRAQTRSEFAAECRATLLQRGVSTDDILAAVRFLVETPSVTGEMIALDAGQHFAWRGA
jgi:NAD(P)-dependent dehydrogenase (short-subunit alcohol dehydrogenase family)